MADPGNSKIELIKNAGLAESADDVREAAGSPLSVLSLFANIGVAEAYLKSLGVRVAVANELIERRAALYSRIYPDTHMICGDITKSSVREEIVRESKARGVNIVMATPPCQGMSTAGQQKGDDARNELVCQVVDVVKQVEPWYIMIENVPLFYSTQIAVGDGKMLIPDFLKQELGVEYEIEKYTIDTKDYSVPQVRERAIVLMSKKGRLKWTLPDKDKAVVTMKDAIGHLPMLDPYVKDMDEKERAELFPHYEERRAKALAISPWHKPPEHIRRQVVAMQHTAPGCTAFDNPVFFPVREDGKPVKGYHNTYKRQNWDTPAYTVTMDNRKISSQNNVHPGRAEYTNERGEVIYSDARTLTLYELMIIMSLPGDWPVPLDVPEAFLRRIIGEGIPPLFVKKLFEKLLREIGS